jgi:DNA ligase-1
MIKRPMLAGKAPDDLTDLRFPLIASPKLDGIRCVKLDEEQVLSRSLKPIPNHSIRERLTKALPLGADGEIMAGNTFQACTSAVMSYEGEPDVTFWMFDLFANGLDRAYVDRLRDMIALFKTSTFGSLVQLVPTVLVHSLDELHALNERYLAEGFEGTMTRDPQGGYKQGRSTTRQQWLLKVKPFEDSEAEIVGFVEMMHNDNEKETNELGLTKRSTKKAGKRPAGTLGKFLARDVNGRFEGVELRIGTGNGLTHALRAEIWENQDRFLGKIVKYKYQDVGTKDAPRLPIFEGFRDPADMS